MCLTYIDKKYSKPVADLKFGYKVLIKKRNPNGTFTYRGPYEALPTHRRGRWSKSSDELIEVGNWKTYQSGFHIFEDFESASDYVTFYENRVVVKVAYKDVVATGRQSVYSSCVVAKKMKLLGEV